MILGGGRREFRPTNKNDEDGKPGKRTDGVDLIQKWETDKKDRKVNYKYVWNKEELNKLDAKTTEYVFGE